jgi:hypothetical protein
MPDRRPRWITADSGILALTEQRAIFGPSKVVLRRKSARKLTVMRIRTRKTVREVAGKYTE